MAGGARSIWISGTAGQGVRCPHVLPAIQTVFAFVVFVAVAFAVFVTLAFADAVLIFIFFQTFMARRTDDRWSAKLRNL